ncbi:HK97 family phage prohead protease [Aerococcus sp. UMB8608]|uniref:Prohead serine protease domain-containing protein n=1 Tax=Aerococcus sanguinicola TaxID=119206 RepID=A0A0X8FCP4_9LACT|nr:MULTISPECIES: HK97 family phage prohead protease [Aerococcus]AMB94906.1 hypothetical protein AWM72_09125 [Aerococcus sanguinicola]MDK6679354.1 HK97 family phage prohead protease [Aerococcus sp. UMB8608]MDK6685804.1 HK97 family phage prohead protease [Aerococcus sp. UMB8623]OFT95891.1 hypothetical protein HMPREF3090_03460 [Aerococcus sp. HMSC23C02]
MSKKEFRAGYFPGQFRAVEDNENLQLSGYFIRYNEPTELSPDYIELVTRDAINRSLKEIDIRCLFNHNTGQVLGRCGNGTLTLKSDDKGLWGTVTINRADSEAIAVYERVKRGDINGCSFGFYPVSTEYTDREDGKVEARLTDIDLFEVSIVTFPAYPQTEIKARNQDLADYKSELLEAKKLKIKETLNYEPNYFSESH